MYVRATTGEYLIGFDSEHMNEQTQTKLPRSESVELGI